MVQNIFEPCQTGYTKKKLILTWIFFGENRVKICIFGPYFGDFEPYMSKSGLKIGTDHIWTVWDRMQPKKLDFETGQNEKIENRDFWTLFWGFWALYVKFKFQNWYRPYFNCTEKDKTKKNGFWDGVKKDICEKAENPKNPLFFLKIP